MAGNWDILIEQGADWRPSPPQWCNDDQTPIDLSTYTGDMIIRPDYGSQAVIAELSTTNGRMILGNDGKISLLLPAALTAAIALDFTKIASIVDGMRVIKVGYYDLRLVSATGFVTKLLSGAVFVAPGTTNGT